LKSVKLLNFEVNILLGALELKIAVFEDELYSRFHPLILLRPVFDLRIGYKSILDRIKHFFNVNSCMLFVRDYLKKSVKEAHRSDSVNVKSNMFDEILFVNGRLIPNNTLKFFFNRKAESKNFVLLGPDKKSIILAKLNGNLLETFLDSSIRDVVSANLLSKFKGKVEFYVSNEKLLIENIWDLIVLNELFLKDDFDNFIGEGKCFGNIDPKVLIYGSKDDLYIGEDSVIEGNVTIDVREGPIYIGRNVEINGPCRIEGPSHIGDDCKVLSGARIRKYSNIGSICRIGGEIESSILHGFVNMYHPSFIGHSYVGEWVNIGAFTVTSDLKNTYGHVKVKIKDDLKDTGLIKLGSFIGDHVKTSINTSIFAGKLIGIFSHLFGYIFDNVPSFTIYAKSMGIGIFELDLESAIRTMKRVYSRRGRIVMEYEIELVKYLYSWTCSERKKFNVVKGRFKFPK